MHPLRGVLRGEPPGVRCYQILLAYRISCPSDCGSRRSALRVHRRRKFAGVSRPNLPIPAVRTAIAQQSRRAGDTPIRSRLHRDCGRPLTHTDTCMGRVYPFVPDKPRGGTRGMPWNWRKSRGAEWCRRRWALRPPSHPLSLMAHLRLTIPTRLLGLTSRIGARPGQCNRGFATVAWARMGSRGRTRI